MRAMVILPNGIMGPVPATIPDDMALPQKFARWPNGIPAPPTEAPSVELKDAPVSPVPDKEPAVLPPARVEPRAPVLQRAFSVNSAIFRIHWTVDAKVLKSSDREKVSPPFEVSMGGKEVQFKMCLRPTVTSESRGGASFRKAKGKGTVDLRCLNELDPARSCPMSFRIAVGKGSDAKRISSTVRHDFSQRAICPLPDGEEEWDFKTVVDEALSGPVWAGYGPQKLSCIRSDAGALLAALCSSLAVGLPLRLAKGALEGVRQADAAQLIADTQEAQRPSILWVQNIGEFILGSILVLLSLTASWFFERQLARLECLVSIGRNNCVSVTEAQEKNWGQLLHIKGDLRAEAPMKDPRFESEVRGAARLRTRVQVFVPGTGWSENVRGAGTRITNSSLVKLDGFAVPDGLLDQLGSFSCLSSVLGLEVRGSDGKAYQRHSDGFYYWRSGKCTAQQIAEAPCEKDLRASFEQSSEKATVLALQAPVKDEMVLLPYRCIAQ
ncbi:unnamed protein product [Effrenium voratum]|uniref:Uncharacterized protein n=1 Tax=Effrenium voratum TaxID=2562239 RepID=A0AA36J7L9_9DINO|nr:unnamed protein product [Effrenium voratum]